MSLTASSLAHTWATSSAYRQPDLAISPSDFHNLTNALLVNPNLNSTHLFRADILSDSAKELQTPADKERQCDANATSKVSGNKADVPSALARSLSDDIGDETAKSREALPFEGFVLQRSVVRRLIPRKPQLDRLLEQSCHMYDSKPSSSTERHLVVYAPHVDSREEMPWYHPPVKALAYLYEVSDRVVNDDATSSTTETRSATLSIHILPFSTAATQPGSTSNDNELPNRLHRTLLSLLQTFIRLAKHPSRPASSPASPASPNSLAPGILKDTILPQHLVQNTYTRLKQKYAHELMSKWVEKTEPSKHVFEDLSIAAFLIELWRQMYQVVPLSERASSPDSSSYFSFPGFVDVACGNGVLVHILLQEGYSGWGFDARRRKSWSIFPQEVQDQLHEMICIPSLFSPTQQQPPCFRSSPSIIPTIPESEVYHDGFFPPGTFIISNHADELTLWTPILAALSCPSQPLPWLIIPCCSHALSGAKYRYAPPKQPQSQATLPVPSTSTSNPQPDPAAAYHDNSQPVTGDLKALRAAKANATAGGDVSSAYACLTNKAIALAEELGCEVDKTLMRIPSTRNIGIVGNRKAVIRKVRLQQQARDGEDPGIWKWGEEEKEDDEKEKRRQKMRRKVQDLVERECKMSGGVEAAAKIWIDGARQLQLGKGKGKVNGGGLTTNRDHVGGS